MFVMPITSARKFQLMRHPSHSKNIVISTFHGRAEHLSFTPKINYYTQLLKTRYKMFFLNIKAVETNKWKYFKKRNNLAQLLIHKVKTNKKIFLYYICIELELCNSLLVLISFKLLTVFIFVFRKWMHKIFL